MEACFPFVPRGNSIHLNPIDATLFSSAGRRRLEASVSAFLRRCDGETALQSVISAAQLNENERIEVLAHIPHLLAEGSLSFSSAGSPMPVRVTGSERAFFPCHLTIELTDACNLHCAHCYRDSGPREANHMRPEDLLACLRKLEAAGLRSVELTGGEPLLYRGFDALVEYCCSAFSIVGILTNGTLITEAKAKFLARFRDKLVVSVSLDGACARTHDSRRGREGAFERTVHAIEQLSQEGIKVRVAMTFDDDNQEEIKPTLDLARRLGAIKFGCAPVLPLGRAKARDATLDFPRMRIADLSPEDMSFLNVTSQSDENEVAAGNCGAGYNGYAMDPRGNIRACASFDADGLVFGNVLTDPPETVFGNSLAWAFARVRSPMEEHCRACPKIAFCKYCTLRGLEAQAEVQNCGWGAQEAAAVIATAYVAIGHPN